MSCVPNGEQYCLLLGDLSTVQNLSCPGVMKCNVLESWVQSLFHEELVMTEVKKPSNATLVLSSAATALQNKDHQPTYLHSFIWSTVHLSNSGKLSLIISVKTVSTKYTSRSNRKFLTVDVSNMKNLFIWSHLSVALSQGATFSTVSFFFFLCRWGRFLSLMSTLAFTKWQQRHHMVSTLLGLWPGYNKQCRANVVQKCWRQETMERALYLHLDLHLHSWSRWAAQLSQKSTGKGSPQGAGSMNDVPTPSHAGQLQVRKV